MYKTKTTKLMCATDSQITNHRNSEKMEKQTKTSGNNLKQRKPKNDNGNLSMTYSQVLTACNKDKPGTTTPHIEASTKKSVVTAPTKRENNCKFGMASTKVTSLNQKKMGQCKANGKSSTSNTNGKVLEDKIVMRPDKNGKSGMQNVTAGNMEIKAVPTAKSRMPVKNSHEDADAGTEGALKHGVQIVFHKGRRTLYCSKKSKWILPKGPINPKLINDILNRTENNNNAIELGTSNDGGVNGGNESNGHDEDNKACDRSSKNSKKKNNKSKAFNTKTHGMRRSKPSTAGKKKTNKATNDK